MARVNLGTFEKGAQMKYTGVLQDESGNAVGSVILTTFTLTVYSVLPNLPIVNGMDHVSILNVGRGTVDSLGNVVVTFSPADMAAPESGLSIVERVMLLEWTWAGGAKGSDQEVHFFVEQVRRF
jgi:hypothetical protein